MRKLHVTIEMANAAFGDRECAESSRLLAKVAADLDYGNMPSQGTATYLFDVNGNKVGKVWVTGKRPYFDRRA